MSPSHNPELIFNKRAECVVCLEVPACPECPDGEICQLTTQSCTECPKTYCQKIAVANPSSNQQQQGNSNSGSSNTGAIAGGVVGGLAAIAVIIFLAWWFYVRPKRSKARLESKAMAVAQDPPEDGTDYEKNLAVAAAQEGDGMNVVGSPGYDGTNSMSQRSISTSSFTRSSNVIPIAYIPGVTTRPVNQQTNTVYDASGVDRSSIATANYRGSTAVISSAMMTAIHARPNLVDIGGNYDPDRSTTNSTTSMSEYSEGGIRTSQMSDIQPIQYAQAVQAVPRMNAHSIAIGNKSTGTLGLQSQYIQEEDESSLTSSTDSDTDSEDEYNDDDVQYGTASAVSRAQNAIISSSIHKATQIQGTTASSVSIIRPRNSTSSATATSAMATPSSRSGPLVGILPGTSSSRNSQASSLTSFKSAQSHPPTPGSPHDIQSIKSMRSNSTLSNNNRNLTNETANMPNTNLAGTNNTDCDTYEAYQTTTPTRGSFASNRYENYDDADDTIQPDMLNTSYQVATTASATLVSTATAPQQAQETVISTSISPSSSSALSRKTTTKSTATKSIVGDDYIADLPIEALLYAQGELDPDQTPKANSNTNDDDDDYTSRKNLTSPFDDKFHV